MHIPKYLGSEREIPQKAIGGQVTYRRSTAAPLPFSIGRGLSPGSSDGGIGLGGVSIESFGLIGVLSILGASLSAPTLSTK